MLAGAARVRTGRRLQSRFHRAYRRAQAVARARRRGIWGARCRAAGRAPSPAPALTPNPGGGSGPAGPLGVGLETVATGFTRPVHVTGRPGASGLVVTELAGRIRVARAGAILAQPLLDISSVVNQAGDERGLLGLAFHPDHAANGLFYVNYVDRTNVTRIVEYRVARGSDRADTASARPILSLAQPSTNHNGGHLAFGPDGMLYAAVGDGGAGGAAAQDLGSLLGAILRIDVGGTQPGLAYRIPPGNPFAATAGARDEIWAYGLRNPWRFSFDRTTGSLWIGDVGAEAREEIDLLAAGVSGVNLGWNAFEGTRAEGGTLRGAVHTPPVAEYPHEGGNCSVTGGHVYRGTRVPGLAGRYVYTDYCSGRFWTLDAARAERRPARDHRDAGRRGHLRHQLRRGQRRRALSGGRGHRAPLRRSRALTHPRRFS